MVIFFAVAGSSCLAKRSLIVLFLNKTSQRACLHKGGGSRVGEVARLAMIEK